MCILFRTIETNAVKIRVEAGCIWEEGEESYRTLFLCAIYLLIRVGREIRFILFTSLYFCPPGKNSRQIAQLFWSLLDNGQCP